MSPTPRNAALLRALTYPPVVPSRSSDLLGTRSTSLHPVSVHPVDCRVPYIMRTTCNPCKIHLHFNFALQYVLRFIDKLSRFLQNMNWRGFHGWGNGWGGFTSLPPSTTTLECIFTFRTSKTGFKNSENLYCTQSCKPYTNILISIFRVKYVAVLWLILEKRGVFLELQSGFKTNLNAS